MHGTDDDRQGPTDRPQVSPLFSHLRQEAGGERWPSTPLVEWSEAELEEFFETLIQLVRYRGRVQ